MKKVGILVNSIGYGGNERSAVNIAECISNRYDVIIFIQEDCGNHYNYQGEVVNLNTPCAKSKFGKALNACRRIFRLKKAIRHKQIDTLIIILPVSNPINYIKFSCRKIVSCRDCGDLIKRMNRYIKMSENSDLMICNSIYQEKLLLNAAPQLKGKTKTIYNIIDINKIKELKKQEIEKTVKQFMENHRCIINVGRFANAKGLNNLLKAFSLLTKKCEDARLLLIGDGELKNKIKLLIQELHINEKVLVIGFDENPFRYISKSDVFVLSSFYEGFPNTLVEAMACETVVVATDCPSGPAEILCGSAQQNSIITEYGILIKPFEEKKSSWDANDIEEDHEIFSNMLYDILKDDQMSKCLVNNANIRINDFRTETIQSDWYEVL